VLADTSWRDRFHPLPLSLRLQDRPTPAQLRQLRVNLAADGLAPDQLQRRSRPVAFVDYVYSGRTFGDEKAREALREAVAIFEYGKRSRPEFIRHLSAEPAFAEAVAARARPRAALRAQRPATRCTGPR
jgi:hypothetical protein